MQKMEKSIEPTPEETTSEAEKPSEENPQEEADKFVPFKDLHTHEELGKYDDAKGKPYGVYNQDELFQSGIEKDYIVKALGGKRLATLRDVETPDQLFEYARELKEKCSELENVFGIPTAPTTFVPSKSTTGSLELFSITEKISGSNLDKITYEELQKFKKDFLENITVHFENLLVYLEAKFADRKRFMADIFINEQYVYGKTKDDSSEKLYLIDLEPQYLEIDKMNDDKLWSHHLVFLSKLLGIMINTEEKWKLPSFVFAGVKEKFRKTYEDLLAVVPESCNTPWHENVRKRVEEGLGVNPSL